MAITKLYDPSNGQMRVVGLMSGSGSNLVKIIEHERGIFQRKRESPYKVVAIFSDNPKSNAVKIGRDFDIPTVICDIKEFYKTRGKPRRDMNVRREFDKQTVMALSLFKASVAAYAGYMALASPVLVNHFIGVNVHPADLSIKNEKGKRKYTGDNAVREALFARERELRASTHIIDKEVDHGPILMISSPISTNLPQNFQDLSEENLRNVIDSHQNALKEVGDWDIFPKTLQYMADGKYARDEKGSSYFNGNPIPNGVRT